MGQKYRKGVTKDFFLFDIWFSSQKLEEAMMEVGVDFIDMVNTNTKVLCE